MCLCYFESELFEGVEDVFKQYPDLMQWMECDGGFHDRWSEHEQFLQGFNADNIQDGLESNKTFVTDLDPDVREALFGAENEHET